MALESFKAIEFLKIEIDRLKAILEEMRLSNKQKIIQSLEYDFKSFLEPEGFTVGKENENAIHATFPLSKTIIILESDPNLEFILKLSGYGYPSRTQELLIKLKVKTTGVTQNGYEDGHLAILSSVIMSQDDSKGLLLKEIDRLNNLIGSLEIETTENKHMDFLIEYDDDRSKSINSISELIDSILEPVLK
ncbi:hypothetical protein KFZ76_08370 [Methylovulum psychrotolerans]|uniref:hypothetical protein n=1 Tax=Methylovulum psychrotolerans TaxID=1704499 RepID=UPI001BFF6512|nr:hypothetical protein [Methylovulum psychrotolerans]MBT9097719.1 hypothetical protein [Methylovulum psychrotolerans]